MPPPPPNKFKTKKEKVKIKSKALKHRIEETYSNFAVALKNFRFFIAVFIFSFLLLNFFGCATVPVSGPAFPVQHFVANNTFYYPLISACQYLDISWDYDPIGRTVILKKDNTEVKLLIDSSTILVNSYPQDIEDAVLTRDGVVCVPQNFKERVLDRYFPNSSAKSPVTIKILEGIKEVVIDAGHGGHDPGAMSKSGLREKDINLDVAKRVGKLFEDARVNVIWTRSTDKFISLEGRSRIANRSSADLFISVHTNGSRSSALNGFEVYYLSDSISDMAKALNAAKNYELNIDKSYFGSNSFALRTVLWDMLNTKNCAESINLAQNIAQSASQNMGLKILGVKSARFYVLKGTNIPAVLVEMGFISNPKEEKSLRNNFYRQQLAEVIFDGVVNYSNKKYNSPGG